MEKKVEKIGTEVEKTVNNLKSIEATPASNKGNNKEKKASKTDAEVLQDEINRKTEELQKCLSVLEHKKQLSKKE